MWRERAGLTADFEGGGDASASVAASAVQRPTAFLNGLQYLRALAASAVVVFHAAQSAGVPFWVGEAGVDLFFLLSGFLMVVITGPNTRPGRFLADRIRRIVPLYWIATSVFLAIALIGLFPRVELRGWHVLSSYLFIPSISPMSGRAWPLLVPGWTLNFEMFFYACFALLLWVRSERQRVALLVGLLACAVATGWWLAPAGAVAATYTSPMLLEFAAGMLIGSWWKTGRAAPRLIGLPSLVVAGVAFLMVWRLDTDHYRVLLFGVPAALLLISVLAIEQRNRIKSYPPSLLIGNASYSIYLWHTMAISVAARAVQIAGLPELATLPLGVGGGLVVGVISYCWIEKPLLNSMQAKSRPSPASPAVLATAP